MAILHYTESGQGEPLILLHSGGMTGAVNAYTKIYVLNRN